MSQYVNRVELMIYDADCPNVAQARSLLIKAFTSTGVSARWREWERGATDSPEYARRYGSPTILVDGRDVAGMAPDTVNPACRVYREANGNSSRIPPLEAVCSALLSASSGTPARTRWQAIVASSPAVGVALLPKLTCPLCFPAYAAVLGALGLEFMDYTPYLLPLTALFLLITIAVLHLRTRRGGSVKLLILGIVAAALVLIGKFHSESDWLTIGGLVLLIAAIFLASRTTAATTASCPACAADGSEAQVEAH